MSEENTPGYTRISTILAPFSGMGAIPKDILAKAADRGTAVHDAIAGMLQGFGEPKDFPFQTYLDSFKLWWREWEVINLNERLFDHDLKITGEYDLIYKDDEGQTVLVDFKTSAKEGKTWSLQGSAYQHLISQGRSIDRIEFVKLSKEGFAPKVYVYPNRWAEFVKVFDVWKMFFENSKEFPEDI